MAAGERRKRIIDSARRLFAERPYEDVSTSDIAESAHTTRTNLHYHFRSKRDLFLAVIEQFSNISEDPVQPDNWHGTSLDTQIAWILGRWLDAIERNKRMFMTMLRASSSVDPQVSGALRESMLAWEQRLVVVLGMDADDPAHQAMIRAFQAMVSDSTAAWLDTGALSKAQVHQLLCRCLMSVNEVAHPTTGDLRAGDRQIWRS